jgi:hypothetical protein
MPCVELVDNFCEGIDMKLIRTIGIANGGGDAPGRNAVIRGVVRLASYDHGMPVSGCQWTIWRYGLAQGW